MDQSRKLWRSDSVNLIRAETLRRKNQIEAEVKLARQQLRTSHALLAQLDDILNSRMETDCGPRNPAERS